jgi:hypothetical protein
MLSSYVFFTDHKNQPQKSYTRAMRYPILITTLTLSLFSICNAQKQPPTNPSAAQAYLQQCIQILEFARDDRTKLVPKGVQTCESAALGDLALKKPAGIRSSSVKVSGYDFMVVVVDMKGKSLSSETDPESYNRVVIQRKAIKMAFERAAQAYVMNCFKALNALFADRVDLVTFPPQLNTCESRDLEQYAQKIPDVVRLSKVGPKDAKLPYNLENIMIEVVLQDGRTYYWDGQRVVLKP